MTKWVLRCKECGTLWELHVSYNLSEFSQFYHYCNICGRNTFHEVLSKE